MKYITPEEASKAIRVLNEPYSTMLALLWFTGLRVSELVGLKVESVDFANRCLTTTCLKKRRHKKERSVPLTEVMLLRLKPFVKGSPEAPLFRHRRGGKLMPYSRKRVWEIVQIAFKKAGLPTEKAHPHSFRHGFAMHSFNSEIPLVKIQKLLGHSDPKATTEYLAFVTEDLREDYERAFGSQ